MTTTTDRILRRIGLNIRHRRVIFELTQAELAKKSGLSISHISGIERGARSSSLLCLARIAKALKTKVQILCENIED